MKRFLCLLLLYALPVFFLFGAAMADDGASSSIAMVNNPNLRDKLFLRPTPSKDTDPLGLYYNGTEVEVLDDISDSTWAKVRIGTLTGYMVKEYLAFDVESRQIVSMNPLVTVSTSNPSGRVSLRELSSRDSNVLEEYANGAGVIVLGVDPEWIHVWIDGKTGFMPVQELSSVDDAVQTMPDGIGYDTKKTSHAGNPPGYAEQLMYTQEVVITTTNKCIN